MKKLLVGLIAGFLMLCFSGIATASTFDEVMENGGNRLIALQNDDGGWDWPLDDGVSTNASPTNTAAPIAMGLLAAYENTGDVTYLDQAKKAGEFIITNSPPHSTGNGIFMNKLSELTGDPKYAADVKNKLYDALKEGTYDKNGTLYDTAGYAQYILDIRGTQEKYNLGIWDVGLAAAGAVAIGADQSELDIWADKLEIGFNSWYGGDGTGIYTNNTANAVIGLAGGIYGLSELGQDLDFAISSGDYYLDGAQTVGDLVNILTTFQTASGGFAYYPDYPFDPYTSVQTTAYAIIAMIAFDSDLYSSNIDLAANWLMDVQLATGGWAGGFAGADATRENNEITGEALWATNAAVPEPTTMLLFGVGLLGLAGVSRRKK